MKRLLYLIGEPGAGKSYTLARALPSPVGYGKRPVPHIRYPGGAQIGGVRGEFSGTDALSYSAMPIVVNWLYDCPYDNLVAEGDRLATDTFFAEVESAGWELCVVEVVCRRAEERRARRHNVPLTQWVKGRQTKVAHLAERWAQSQLDTNDGDGAVEYLRMHPVVAAMHEEVQDA